MSVIPLTRQHFNEFELTTSTSSKLNKAQLLAFRGSLDEDIDEFAAARQLVVLQQKSARRPRTSPAAGGAVLPPGAGRPEGRRDQKAPQKSVETVRFDADHAGGTGFAAEFSRGSSAGAAATSQASSSRGTTTDFSSSVDARRPATTSGVASSRGGGYRRRRADARSSLATGAAPAPATDLDLALDGSAAPGEATWSQDFPPPSTPTGTLEIGSGPAGPSSPTLKETRRPFTVATKFDETNLFDTYRPQTQQRMGRGSAEVQIEKRLHQNLRRAERQKNFDSLMKSDGTFKRQVLWSVSRFFLGKCEHPGKTLCTGPTSQPVCRSLRVASRACVFPKKKNLEPKVRGIRIPRFPLKC